jgi:hypothetical protein
LASRQFLAVNTTLSQLVKIHSDLHEMVMDLTSKLNGYCEKKFAQKAESEQPKSDLCQVSNVCNEAPAAMNKLKKSVPPAVILSSNNENVMKNSKTTYSSMIRRDYSSNSVNVQVSDGTVPPKPSALSAVNVDKTHMTHRNPRSNSEDKGNESKFSVDTYQRRPRPKPIVRTSNADNSIAGVHRSIHLHVWRFKEDTTVEAITKFVSDKLPDKYIDIEQLKVSKGAYASFRVSASADLKESLGNPDFWLENVWVNRFFFRKAHLSSPKG